MGKSKIEWTDYTFNPWIGCTKVSQGCKFCYAERDNQFYRWNKAGWGPQADRRRTSAANWKKPLQWNAEAKKTGQRMRVFCASLADVFDDHASILPELRSELWYLIEQTPELDWMLLTKRPENFASMLPKGPVLENVWLGVTAEDQENADKRIPILLSTPALVRFVSCEPLLGDVDLSRWLWNVDPRRSAKTSLDWVIAGCESGYTARSADPDWFRSLQSQCYAALTPFFLKQMVVNGKFTKMPALDGKVYNEIPEGLYHDL